MVTSTSRRMALMEFLISSSVIFSLEELLFRAIAVVLHLLLLVVSGTYFLTKSRLSWRELARLL